MRCQTLTSSSWSLCTWPPRFLSFRSLSPHCCLSSQPPQGSHGQEPRLWEASARPAHCPSGSVGAAGGGEGCHDLLSTLAPAEARCPLCACWAGLACPLALPPVLSSAHPLGWETKSSLEMDEVWSKI